MKSGKVVLKPFDFYFFSEEAKSVFEEKISERPLLPEIVVKVDDFEEYGLGDILEKTVNLNLNPNPSLNLVRKFYNNMTPIP